MSLCVRQIDDRAHGSVAVLVDVFRQRSVVDVDNQAGLLLVIAAAVATVVGVAAGQGPVAVSDITAGAASTAAAAAAERAPLATASAILRGRRRGGDCTNGYQQ